MIKTYYIRKKNMELIHASTEAALAAHRKGDDVVVKRPDGSYIPIRGVKVETEREKSDRENRAYCKRIAVDLELYADGRVYKCDECGEIIIVPEDWSGKKYKCPDCGTVSEEQDLIHLDLSDYFEDVLDVDYTCNYRKAYTSVKLWVTLGGPGVCINTAAHEVQLFWGGDTASYPIDWDVCDEIDGYWENIYNGI